MSAQSAIFNPTNTTSAATGDGFSVPRLTTTGRLAITFGTSDAGMMVYDTTLNNLFIWNGSAWESVPASGDAGANGSVQYNDNGVVSGAVNFVWDKTNSRVGIGTASPGYALDAIGGFSNLVARFLRIGDYGEIIRIGRSGVSETASINYPSDGTFAINTLSSQRFSIDGSGVCAWSNVGGVAGTAMTLNSTGLGVGTSPTGKLTIGTGAYVAGTLSGTSSLYSTVGQGLVVLADGFVVGTRTGGDRFVLDTSGNVGIGVAPSATDSTYFQALEIARVGQGLTAAKNVLTGSPSSWLSNNSYATYSSGVVWNYAISQPASQYRLFEGQHQWYTAPSGTAGNAITFTERLRLKETGQLRFVPLASDPSGAEAGDVYYNSTSNKLKCYNGTTWNDLF